MPTAATRQRPGSRAPGRQTPTASVRGWATLVVLIVIVAVVSVGPGTVLEFVVGLTFARPPTAATTAPMLHPEPRLQARLDALAASVGHGRLGAVVVDLQSGAMASLDADQAYPAASLFKIPILLAVLAEEDAGRLDPERTLQIRAEDWTEGSGVLQARVGEQLRVRELTRLMIQDSDNIAALVLLDVVDVARINAINDRLGLRATRLVDRRGGERGDHTTSASDMARVFVGLATGQLLSQRVAEKAVRLLELKQTVSWLGDDLPFWVKVAHKWGDLPPARHDAGIVFTPRGSYAIAVLTDGCPPQEAASTIAQASRIAYDYLGSR